MLEYCKSESNNLNKFDFQIKYPCVWVMRWVIGDLVIRYLATILSVVPSSVEEDAIRLSVNVSNS